jgi:hypothetical protein
MRGHYNYIYIYIYIYITMDICCRYNFIRTQLAHSLNFLPVTQNSGGEKFCTGCQIFSYVVIQSHVVPDNICFQQSTFMLTDVSEMLLWNFAHFFISMFVRCIDSNIYSTVSICWQFPLHIWDISLLRITSQENVYPKNNIASDNTVNVGNDFGTWNSIVRYCKMFQRLHFLPQLVKCSRPTVFSKLYTICKSKSSGANL